jgi:hypothetical protein
MTAASAIIIRAEDRNNGGADVRSGHTIHAGITTVEMYDLRMS